MKQILHILKTEDALYPLAIMRKECLENRLNVLLIQEATQLVIDPMDATIFVLSDDLREGDKTPYPKIGYEEMLDLIFKSDSVITW